MKFIATTSDKVSSIEVKMSQMIFSTDDRVIYVDTDKRTSFQQIMILGTEELRVKLDSPVEGFYFVEETSVLWRYSNAEWKSLTTPPTENMVFLEKENFPVEGKNNILYIDKTNDVIYRWDITKKDYVLVSGSASGTLTWEPLQ